MPASNSKHPFFLGVDDQELAIYNDAEQAAHDVHDQATGYLKGDEKAGVQVPKHIVEWKEREPQNWHY